MIAEVPPVGGAGVCNWERAMAIAVVLLILLTYGRSVITTLCDCINLDVLFPLQQLVSAQKAYL